MTEEARHKNHLCLFRLCRLPVQFFGTMLDPRRLQLLLSLESLGTMRAVAAAESMSTSAVSQQLAVLERECGVDLLEALWTDGDADSRRQSVGRPRGRHSRPDRGRRGGNPRLEAGGHRGRPGRRLHQRPGDVRDRRGADGGGDPSRAAGRPQRAGAAPDDPGAGPRRDRHRDHRRLRGCRRNSEADGRRNSLGDRRIAGRPAGRAAPGASARTPCGTERRKLAGGRDRSRALPRVQMPAGGFRDEGERPPVQSRLARPWRRGRAWRDDPAGPCGGSVPPGRVASAPASIAPDGESGGPREGGTAALHRATLAAIVAASRERHAGRGSRPGLGPPPPVAY